MISFKSFYRDRKHIFSRQYFSKYLSIKFIIGSIDKLFFELLNPTVPWLNKDAVKFLIKYTKKNDVYLECGSGQSTVWFAHRVKKIISIEHDFNWYEVVKQKINVKRLKLDYIIAKTKKSYIQAIKNLDDESVDICLVDGNWRADCIIESSRKVKVGGILILDNAETCFPVTWKSNSYQTFWSERGCPDKASTLKAAKILKNWRMIVTGDVSQDTIFWIKQV